MWDWQDFISFKTICYDEKMKQSRINVDRSEHLYSVLLWHESYETNICGEYWWLCMVVRPQSPSNFVWFANWITGLMQNYKQWQKGKDKAITIKIYCFLLLCISKNPENIKICFVFDLDDAITVLDSSTPLPCAYIVEKHTCSSMLEYIIHT